MPKEIITIDGIVNRPGSFHQVVRANGFLFLASQLSCDLKTGKIIPGSIQEQTRRALDNVRFLITACGGQMEDVVKVVIYMKDVKLRDEINAVYSEYFKPGTEPVKTSVQALSPVPDIDIEIEVTAVAG